MTDQQFTDTVTTLASELGQGWEPQFSYEEYSGKIETGRFTLCHNSKPRLYAYHGWGKEEGYYKFSGLYPKDGNGRSFALRDDPECGCNLNRGAQAVAADIKRRLLARVNSLYLSRQRQAAEADAKRSQHVNQASEIAMLLGGEITDRHNEFYTLTVEIYDVAFRVHRDYGIELSCRRLSMEAAKQIAMILNAERKQHAAAAAAAQANL